VKVTDINKTLQPPAGLRCSGVKVTGAYIVLCYQNDDYTRKIEIILNDQGREVLRVENGETI